MIANTYETGKFYIGQSVMLGDIKALVVCVQIRGGAESEPYRLYQCEWFQNGDIKSYWLEEYRLEAA